MSDLKGHSTKIKCLQTFISLSRSKSRLCQPSEIVFLSSIALPKRKIWRKTFGPISILIPYHFMLRCWRTKVANFRYCPPVGRRRVLMGLSRARSTTTKRNDRLYRQFSFSVSGSNARLWLKSRSVVCGRSELYREISGNVKNDMNFRFKRKRHSSPIFDFFPRNAPLTKQNSHI